MYINRLYFLVNVIMAQKSVFSIATRYCLDGPGIESLWGGFFHTQFERPWGPPSLLYNLYRNIPAVKAAGK